MTQGRFVWFDLMTSDMDAAIRFYAETIGWKAVPWKEDATAPYTMFQVSDRGIGGVMPLTDEMKAHNVPPHWIGSVLVNDVDAIASKTTELGGSVLRPAWDIPTVGRIAVLADPQGAAFMVFCPLKDMMPPPSNEMPTGFMSWNELNTTDYESAWTFYSGLFGWIPTESMDMGEHGAYYMFAPKEGERTMGGMCNMAKAMNVPPHWLHYTTVDGCEAALARITANGGTILNGPMEVPGGDWVAQCQDPQGAAFAIHSTTK